MLKKNNDEVRENLKDGLKMLGVGIVLLVICIVFGSDKST